MSVHYTINVAIQLTSQLKKTEIDFLEYLINGNGKLPIELPSHDFFSSGEDFIPYRKAYAEFPVGQFFSQFWSVHISGQTVNGVHLLMPGIKDTGGWWEGLNMISWLSSLSDINEFIGTIVDDLPTQGVEFLYTYDKKLYFGKAPKTELTCFTTGEKKEINL